MQLEAGKKYTDRRGRVYGPLVANHALFGECRENYTWSIDGRVSQCREYDIDLVAEYVEPAPVESPDDWVILDPVVYADHELRKDIDWIFVADWQPVDGYNGCTIDEFILIPQNKVRCRRRDLPPVPPKTRTVVLKEWICWDDDGPVITLWQDIDPATAGIDYNNFHNAVATGETRTVEIPVT